MGGGRGGGGGGAKLNWDTVLMISKLAWILPWYLHLDFPLASS